MIDVQTIAADVMKKYAPAIERGKSRRERLAGGESYADTIHKRGAEMRALMGDELPKLRQERDKQKFALKERDRTILRQYNVISDVQDNIIAVKDVLAALRAKIAKNERLAEKSHLKAAEGGERAEKAMKRAEDYERRAQSAREGLEQLTERQKALSSSVSSLEVQNEDLSAQVAQKKTPLLPMIERRRALKEKYNNLIARRNALKTEYEDSYRGECQVADMEEKLLILKNNHSFLKKQIRPYQNG